MVEVVREGMSRSDHDHKTDLFLPMPRVCSSSSASRHCLFLFYFKNPRVYADYTSTDYGGLVSVLEAVLVKSTVCVVLRAGLLRDTTSAFHNLWPKYFRLDTKRRH
ncbi:hypothetical protein AcV7_004017 [Taiwanofungus camphoratus]|nr:hypothetical protein AcV7_004017 [Antrodia cinnamomea]